MRGQELLRQDTDAGPKGSDGGPGDASYPARVSWRPQGWGAGRARAERSRELSRVLVDKGRLWLGTDFDVTIFTGISQ